jgi:long-chain acyl-CoA synthetase
MCTHRGIEAVAHSVEQRFPQDPEAPPNQSISYLPLCHVAEQAFTNFLGIRQANVTYFCADLNKIKDYLLVARPQMFFGVPRVWEKFEAAMNAKLLAATGLKKALANWALRVELESASHSIKSGETVNSLQRRLANKLVISKIKQAIGFDRLDLAGAGAAPTSLSTLEFFASIGVLIHEGLGMTETTGLVTTQPPGFPRFGTVGQVLDGMQARIADDGEILLRGPNMVKGYLHMPEATDRLYSEDGWMHTGDLGALDEDGFLTITGRKKDLLITAGGKNVAPAEMENHLQGIPGVGQAIVVGDRQPYLCAILALEEDALADLCQAAGVALAPLAEIASNEKIRSFLTDRVESDCNSKVAQYQTIKKIEVLPHMLSIEADELTPTLKVKRNVITDRYEALISSLYD